MRSLSLAQRCSPVLPHASQGVAGSQRGAQGLDVSGEHDAGHDNRTAGQSGRDSAYVAAATFPHGLLLLPVLCCMPPSQPCFCKYPSRGPPLMRVDSFLQVLNCIFNYLIQFPAPTGAYLQVAQHRLDLAAWPALLCHASDVTSGEAY